MPIYVGINNSQKQVSDIYVGINTEKKNVSDAYISKDGVLYPVFITHGSQIITESGIFTVPKGVYKIDVFMVGAGGGGGYTEGAPKCACGGGGGYTKTIKKISVKPGDEFPVVIGNGINGGNGESTSFGDYTVNGGYKGTTTKGGDGGSGGGGWGSDGGSDGSNGKNVHNYSGDIFGIGQGSSTRAFGESDGTLYSGGGGSSRITSSDELELGSGGEGGGGCSGGSHYTPDESYEYESRLPENGYDNTGGGGGGGVRLATSIVFQSTKGGSGIVIVRW